LTKAKYDQRAIQRLTALMDLRHKLCIESHLLLGFEIFDDLIFPDEYGALPRKFALLNLLHFAPPLRFVEADLGGQN